MRGFDADDVVRELTRNGRGVGALLALEGEGVCAFFGDCREPVVQILRGSPHEQSVLRPHAHLDQSWVCLRGKVHGVSAHVFNTTGDGELNLTERNL